MYPNRVIINDLFAFTTQTLGKRVIRQIHLPTFFFFSPFAFAAVRQPSGGLVHFPLSTRSLSGVHGPACQNSQLREMQNGLTRGGIPFSFNGPQQHILFRVSACPFFFFSSSGMSGSAFRGSRPSPPTRKMSLVKLGSKIYVLASKRRPPRMDGRFVQRADYTRKLPTGLSVSCTISESSGLITWRH
jgi:hypothetical protein